LENGDENVEMNRAWGSIIEHIKPSTRVFVITSQSRRNHGLKMNIEKYQIRGRLT
jgi:hypothetical protein